MFFRTVTRIIGKVDGKLDILEFLWNAAGTTTSRCLLRTQIGRMIAREPSCHCVELLLDVERCFDNVDRMKYMELAMFAGYPELAFHYSSAMNEEPRRILWDGGVAGDEVRS